MSTDSGLLFSMTHWVQVFYFLLTLAFCPFAGLSETEAENNDAKRLKTTVVIDSDGEREEVEECARAERFPRDDVGGNKKSEGGKSSKEIAEVVVLGSRKDSSQQVQLEKSRSQV